MENQLKVELKKYEIIEFNMSTNQNFAGDEISMNLSSDLFVMEESSKVYKIVLNLDVDATKRIQMKIEGIFEFSSDKDKSMIDNFLNVTAPSILYPYCRSFLSMVTGFDSTETIVLPIINFNQSN